MPRSFLKASALLVYPLMVIYAFLLVPAYEIIAFDITLASTLLFDGVDMLMGWVEIIVLALALALLITAVYRAGSAVRCRALYILLGGALLLKYIGSIIALSVVHGALDATLNYGSYVLSLLLELLPLALAVLLTHRYTVRTNADAAIRKKALERLSAAPEAQVDLLPFKNPFHRPNPLQKIALLALGLICAIRLLAYIMNEIAYVILGFSFKASDLPVTLLYAFLTVLLPCFIGYLLCVCTTKLAAKAYK
ncbi:MAG: hypothetical protein E7639_04850 [Ruminococcaceae bacterium]|nr:hypothetical protein [Oscillospiraceae bacterium]